MSTIHPGKLEGILQNKFGFEPVKGRSDHRWYELRLPGLPPIRTKVSHSRDPIGPNLQGKIARQLRVTKPYFVGMVSCQNSKADYERQVVDDPHPPFDILF
jgi:hypothetical protein